MTTTQALAAKIQARTTQPGRVGLDPFTIIALIGALTQLAIQCLPLAQNLLAWLRGDDKPIFPRITLALRRRRILNAIRDQWHGPYARLGEVQRAILAELDTLTLDQLADLYADHSAKE